MARALSTRLGLRFTCEYIDPIDLSTPTDSMDYSLSQALATGTGANKADRLFHDSYSVVNTTQSIDLATITDAFGQTLVLVKCNGVLVVNKNTTAGQYITIDPTVANSLDFGLTGLVDDNVEIQIDPLGCFLIWSPVDKIVIDGTHKIIGLDSTGSGATVAVDVIVIGATA